MPLSNDSPISRPADDLFGLDPFARAIADGILRMAAPNGMVLAINGQWGAGKSSAINLIRHHLADAVATGRLSVVNFNPWWFAGGDTLTLALFQELNVAVGVSLPKRLRESFSVIGQSVSAAGPLMAAAANLKAPGSGVIVGNVAKLVGRFSGRQKTVEQRHAEIAAALEQQTRRFLIVIDDIDRLNPDDAMTIFRLVKSVARLPNVIYLLAFDRLLAEGIVGEAFPSEGPSYLEKIVQASFEIPPPSLDVLRNQLLTAVFEVIGRPDERQMVRFMNVFFDVIAPSIATPRDVVRLVNDLVATWPAVAGNVDRADFMGLAALRISEPALYRAIRDNPDALCDTAEYGLRGRDDQRPRYDRMFRFDDTAAVDVEAHRQCLMRLFPRLEGVWANTHYTATDEWRSERRLCSKVHFETYFAFTVAEGTIPAADVNALLASAENPEVVRAAFLASLEKRRRDGSTCAGLLLEELSIHSADVDRAKVAPFLTTLFALADELDVEADQKRGFAIADNQLRIHWLLNRLVTERFDLDEREKIYSKAMETASVAWACDFASRCCRAYEPVEEGRSPGEAIVSESVATNFRAMALAKLRAAAADGTLLDRRGLASLLFEWRRLSPEGADEVRRWTGERLTDDRFVLAMTSTMTSVGWAQGMGWNGMGDRVARRTIRVHEEPFREIVDVTVLDRRAEELIARPDLDEADRSILETYRNAPRGRHD